MTPFLMGAGARSETQALAGGVAAGRAAAAMPVVQWVVLKMLPFDNKSEFQLVLDMPEGATLEQTERTLLAVGRELARVPEVKDYQIYAGTAAPINFNGLVRHYFIRSGANVGDIQVNLVDKHERDRSSHEIARSVRAPCRPSPVRQGQPRWWRCPRDRRSGRPSSPKCMARRRPPVKPLPAPYRPASWPRRIWWTWTSI
jgi:multidrug efflux pump subunit AcrB